MKNFFKVYQRGPITNMTSSSLSWTTPSALIQCSFLGSFLFFCILAPDEPVERDHLLLFGLTGPVQLPCRSLPQDWPSSKAVVRSNSSKHEGGSLLPIQLLSQASLDGCVRSVAEGENTVRVTCPRSIVVCQKVFRGMTSGFNSSLCSHHRMEQPSASLFLNVVWIQPTFLDEMGLPHPRSKNSSSSRPLFSLTFCFPLLGTLLLVHFDFSSLLFPFFFWYRLFCKGCTHCQKKSKKNPIHAFLFIYSFNSTFFT